MGAGSESALWLVKLVERTGPLYSYVREQVRPPRLPPTSGYLLRDQVPSVHMSGSHVTVASKLKIKLKINHSHLLIHIQVHTCCSYLVLPSVFM